MLGPFVRTFVINWWYFVRLGRTARVFGKAIVFGFMSGLHPFRFIACHVHNVPQPSSGTIQYPSSVSNYVLEFLKAYPYR